MTPPLPASRPAWRSMVGEFGCLALIWFGEALGLERYALPASMVLVTCDAALRLRRGTGFPPLWLALNGGALGFGLATILLRDRLGPELFGALCALSLALVFLHGSFWRISLVQQLAEHRHGRPLDHGPDGTTRAAPGLDRFFRLYTRIWAAFFALRALIFVHLAQVPAHEATGVLILKLSLIGMIALSFCGRRLYRFYRACHKTA